MMAIVLHGLTRHAPALEGVDLPASRARVLICDNDDLAAICSPSPWSGTAALSEEQEMEEALRHHDVLTQVSSVTDVVPVRFGTVFSTEAVLLRHLEARRELYVRCAEKIAGKAEIALRITRAAQSGSAQEANCAPGDSAQDPSGRNYLARQRRVRDMRRKHAEAVREILEEAVACCQRHACAGVPGRPGGERLLDASFLVPKPCIAELEAAVARLREHATPLGLRFSVLGPWPPYSFCDTADVAQSHAAARAAI